MKKVYCYFESLLDGPAHQGELIQLWHRSWEKHGWDVRMLSLKTVRNSRLASTIPTGWPQLDTLRARQIISLAEAGGGLMVDYDLINFGFRPRHLPGKCNLLSSGLCHCTRELAREARLSFTYLTFLRQFSHHRLSADYNESGWDDASLVHFGSLSCFGRPKHEAIERCNRHF